MKDQEIQDLADAAANKAISHIQKHLGQTDGGFAGLHFSGNNWDALLAILGHYIKAEVKNASTRYDFKNGELVRLVNGHPERSWTIYDAPTHELRACISQNDPNGDFENLAREQILEIFIHDFIYNKG